MIGNNLQYTDLKERFDSLWRADSLHKAQFDSIQKDMTDSINCFYSQLDCLNANNNPTNVSDFNYIILILWLGVVCLLSWLVWKLFLSTYYKKIKSPIKRILIIALSGIAAIVFARFALLYVWYLIIICLVTALVWWMVNHFRKKKGKSMLEKKDYEVNYDDNSSFSSVTKEEMLPVKVANDPCVAAVASDTRKAKNQDSCSEAFVQSSNARIIAIADGVGSSYKSEVGSHFVTEKAVELLKKAVEIDEYHIDFNKIFDDIQESLDVEVERICVDELNDLKPSSFGTTLIVGIDFPDRFVTAYIGNGSIWHISGYFNKFPSVVCLPWNAVNLLNPDTTMVGGKEALYKIFFYKGDKKNHRPTVLQISKLRESPGDIFILTTDGVYSSDHAIASKDEDGDIWVPSTAQYGLLYELLKNYMESNDDINDETLKKKLETYLAHIKEAQIMDDDTTLGIFISAEARAHFTEDRMKNETN